ncbi:MAG: alpha/beta hydrolase [Pseudomonadota bacterium]|nr:alpha/beta hydrolase [Pseudomonadota bacterium]
MLQPQRIGSLDVYIEGTGSQTIVMVHGWPDTYRVWDAQVNALAADYRCVRVTLPNYAEQGARSRYSIDAVAHMLAQVVQTVSPDQPVILLLHDWGCAFGYRFYQQHPERVSRLIGLDIGDAASRAHLKSLKWYQLAMLGTYQLNLAVAWLLPEVLGTSITRGFAKLLQQPTPAEAVHRGMNYPYFQAVFQALSQPIKPFTDVPACPMLFVYAKHKPFMFHSTAWTTRLQQRAGNQVIAMAAGHWMMREQPDQFNQILLDWLNTVPLSTQS